MRISFSEKLFNKTKFRWGVCCKKWQAVKLKATFTSIHIAQGNSKTLFFDFFILCPGARFSQRRLIQYWLVCRYRSCFGLWHVKTFTVVVVLVELFILLTTVTAGLFPTFMQLRYAKSQIPRKLIIDPKIPHEYGKSCLYAIHKFRFK